MFLAFALSFSGLFMVLELFRINKYLSRFLAITPLFFLFAMVAFNRMNRDYPVYQFAFLDSRFRDSLEFGYALLVRITDKLGGDQATIAFIAGIFLVSILLIKLKTSNYVNMVVFCYCGFPLIYDITQTRNFLMYLIIILSLGYVEKNKPVKHYILLFFAFSMHTFAVAYAPFYYLCKKNRKKFISIMLWTTALFIIGSPIVIMLLTLVFPEKMNSYMMRTPGLGTIANYVYVIIDILTICWVDRKISGKLSEQDSRKMEVLYRFVWFPILILPFSHYFLEIIRLERNALLIKYIYCALAMPYLSVKQRLFTMGLLLISVIMYFVMLDYTNQWDMVDYLDDNFVKYYLDKYLF